MDCRVKRGYTVHMRKQVFEEGAIIEHVTHDEYADHHIRLEDVGHEAMRAALTPEQHDAEDLKAKLQADVKFSAMYERTLNQVAKDLVEKNPALAYRVAVLVEEKQIAESAKAMEVQEQSTPVNAEKEFQPPVEGMTQIPAEDPRDVPTSKKKKS